MSDDELELEVYYSNPYQPHGSGFRHKKLKMDMLELAERREKSFL